MQYEIHPKHLIRNLTIIGSFLWVMLGGMIADSMVMMGLATGVVLSVAILISLLRFSLQIEPTVLIYRISFRHHIFVEKEVKPEEIERIKFFRSGVNEKAAIIKRKLGLMSGLSCCGRITRMICCRRSVKCTGWRLR
ncbi:hypothetical protein [Halobacillus salinus]|uniref:Uncharacterized protein n=1 Tax=Halobacillus salinus TaxID=192814 RepID=A0A4Z0GV81_9BACI|nr:hypothetical protein [Halobacillus salinus]TGB00746.1 hypothetical protein E4663_19210 [Halobacillus salinus]